tara:strand:+ start:874 stop:1650 length:777 start_codon:yes stop_codon:yes gene_type:complete
MDKPIEILRMRDKGENHYTNKGDLFNLPMKLLVIGRSQLSGKTNFIGAMLLSDDKRLYGDDFDGENIYLFSPSATTDHKLKVLIKQKEIPNSNIFPTMNDEIIEIIYESVENNYIEKISENEKPPNVLFIFDDMSFGGKTKTDAVEKLFCNGRHLNISTIISAQKYSQLSTCARENATGMIMFASTDKQLELMSEDNNYYDDKKDFRKLFRKLTSERHSFMAVNYSNDFSKMYLNRHFQPVGKCGGVIGKDCKCKGSI